MSEGSETAARSNASPAAAASSAPAIFFGLTLGQAVVMLAWPVLLLSGVYSFLLVKKQDVQVLEAAIRSRPAIKVVDVTAVMRSNIAQGMTADQSIMQANATFQKLGKAGYIVIDNNAILAAPAAAELK